MLKELSLIAVFHKLLNLNLTLVTKIKKTLREIAFIKQNAEKWERFDGIIKNKGALSPDEMSDLYMSLQDDLSYARTFYPKSNTTKYLNELTGHFHRAIYKNKHEKSSRFWTFWKYEVPYAVGRSHRQIFYALAFFVVSIAIGVISSAYDEDFVRLILGDSYVNVTLENIHNGDPMAVYDSMHRTGMFLAISSNNILVSFKTYVEGIFFSIGSVFELFQNGVMLGSFQYFFYERHLFLTSVMAIYLHGALELSALVIAGGAGIVLGNSILFPGTFSRLDSLMEAGKRSLKIIVGLVPVFITAALIESFVTRLYNKMPSFAHLIIIGVSFSFIIWYFIIYPIQLKNKKNGREVSPA
ncbi:MAG: hypothetical protein JWO03_1313 [Bacteroidetes bacterium]|nr:hypothetical protein [Bacteroidota bacterium]